MTDAPLKNPDAGMAHLMKLTRAELAARYMALLEKHQALERSAAAPEMRCCHCGREEANAKARGSTHCTPPFDVQPHEFTKPVFMAKEPTL